MKEHSEAQRFAVDFVILPPDAVMDYAISLNKRLCKDSTIVLDKGHCFPHISLLMGCLRVDQFEQAVINLKTIASQHKVMSLGINHTSTVKSVAGDIFTLDIEPHKGLQDLHETIVRTFGSSLSRDAAEGDVFGEPTVGTSTLDWINNFIPHSCYENFWPHITVGHLRTNVTPQDIKSMTFTASRIAVCHLGNFCTCRRILSESSLGG